MKTILTVGRETFYLPISKPEQLVELLNLLSGAAEVESKTHYADDEGEHQFNSEWGFFSANVISGAARLRLEIVRDEDLITREQFEEREAAARQMTARQRAKAKPQAAANVPVAV